MKNRIRRFLIPGSQKPAWESAWLKATLCDDGPIIYIEVHERVITIEWTDETDHYKIAIDIKSGATSVFTKTSRNRKPYD